MSGDLLATVVVIACAMGFNYTNGFHDAANAIATSVSTRALTPRVALAVAALGNLGGSFLGGKVAATVGTGVVTLPSGLPGLSVVLAGLIGAIAWNLATWRFGIPSSSSHALIGGLVGATLLANGGQVLWTGIVEKVLLPMVVSPVVGLVLGYLVMIAVLWIFRRGQPRALNRGFRVAQSVSAFAMSIGHGMQDAAKTIGVVGLALLAGGHLGAKQPTPWWVYLMTAAVLALGTYSGGWRIIGTLGRRIIHLDPPHGFAAEATASAVLFVTSRLGLPISTTHTITAAIMGVGATKRLSAVRWGVASNIVTAWILTFPAAAAVAALVYLVLRLA
ncbi:MAG TPA: inorganic phosphate transporter [Rugosimonospora sp.]|nr:inorganic phosphate transporter [Rugosimonospora sp.]